MYVNATYAILCNNYGNNPFLLFQTLLQLLSRNPATSPAQPSSCVHERAANIGGQPPANLSPAGLPALLATPLFSHQTTHTPLSPTEPPQTFKTFPTILACSHLQTCEIISSYCHSGPNCHTRGHCNSCVSQVCLLSRSQMPLSLPFAPGHQSNESE